MSDYREAIDAVLQEVGRAVVGKEEITEKIMMAILAGGHILVENIPGMGKTTMALAFSKVYSGCASCRPDRVYAVSEGDGAVCVPAGGGDVQSAAGG